MSISSESIWLTKNPKKYKSLDKDLAADAVIIGGGIAGVTTAYLLSKLGQKVILVEKGRIGQSATGYTTAMITKYLDTNIADLIKMYGPKRTKLIWQSGEEAIDLIEKIVHTEKIECEFMRVPYYIFAKNEKQNRELINEKKAARKLRIALEYKTDRKLPLENSGYLKLKNQAKFHPYKYVSSLAAAATKNGVQIYEQTSIDSLENVNAKHIIVTTHVPFTKPFELFFKKAKYKTYMIYAKIPKELLSESLYQDISNPYHYFRIDSNAGYDTILLGGEDHRADIPVDPKKSFKALEEYLKTLLPNSKYQILNQWAGPIIETIDGLPYIGPLHSNNKVLYATGFSGTGMIWGSLSGLILSDLVNKKKNKYYELYKATRVPSLKQLWFKGKDFTQIFLGGAVKNSFNFLQKK